MLAALDVLFLVFHTGLIFFNGFGWIWPRLRMLHLATMAATLFSWIVMGYWRGIGYCLCTDWHWQIRRELGLEVHADGYMQFLLKTLLGVEIPSPWLEVLVGLLFATSGVIATTLALREAKRPSTA